MPKTIRERKMLQRVRLWRAKACEALRREPEAVRRQRAKEWARRVTCRCSTRASTPISVLIPPWRSNTVRCRATRQRTASRREAAREIGLRPDEI